MKPEQWQKVKVLFDDLLQCEPDRRPQFLDQVCQDDLELRAEVESLLTAYEQAGSFITAPAIEDAAHLLFEEAAEPCGERQIGHYHLLTLLGKGGMGEVYLAVDASLGRKVALKLLPAEFTHDAARVKRFEREARIASGLNHPNILTIYETGRDGDTLFIATEFVQGKSLRQRLAAGPIDLMEAVGITIQIAAALEAAHGAGVLHRDIKPENIMLRPDGIVKTLDFGLAKPIEGLIDRSGYSASPVRNSYESAPGLLIGTIRYMSPEQVRGRQLDARSDLWSLGVTLYEMTAGAAPFDGETPSDVIAAILTFEPPTLAEPGRPELQHILKRALAKQRSQRYSSANELAMDLKNLERELHRRAETEARPIAPVAPVETEQFSKNRRWAKKPAAVLMIVSALVLPAVLFYSISRLRPASPPIEASDREAERVIDYSLIVQKMQHGQSIGDSFEATGQEIFESGWQFRLRLVSAQPGHLYLLNEGPASAEAISYRSLFPVPPLNQGSSRLAAKEPLWTGWYVFDDRSGVEKLWIIWTAMAVDVLEAARRHLNPIDAGLIGDLAQRESIREWLARRAADRPMMETDPITHKMTMRGRGETLVGVIELNHR